VSSTPVSLSIPLASEHSREYYAWKNISAAVFYSRKQPAASLAPFVPFECKYPSTPSSNRNAAPASPLSA